MTMTLVNVVTALVPFAFVAALLLPPTPHNAARHLEAM